MIERTPHAPLHRAPDSGIRVRDALAHHANHIGAAGPQFAVGELIRFRSVEVTRSGPSGVGALEGVADSTTSAFVGLGTPSDAPGSWKSVRGA